MRKGFREVEVREVEGVATNYFNHSSINLLLNFSLYDAFHNSLRRLKGRKDRSDRGRGCRAESVKREGG